MQNLASSSVIPNFYFSKCGENLYTLSSLVSQHNHEVRECDLLSKRAAQ